MIEKLDNSWFEHLKLEFSKPYFLRLKLFVEQEYNTTSCFPKKENIFNAFNYCPFDVVKVVIIGQDPYHDYGQANGLCFSVNDDIKHPPSLKNIFKEREHDLGIAYPTSGNLKYLALQGVLLLNATLTVRAHKPASHQKKGWETFTNEVIKTISKEKEGVVFLLWGGFAKQKIKLIDHTKHYVLTSGHPSPLSANRGFWFGNKHFSETNSLLEQDGLDAILW